MQRSLRLARPIAGLLGAHRREGDGFVGRVQPTLELGLRLGAGAQLGRDMLARLAIARQGGLELRNPRGHRYGGLLEDGDQTHADGRERLVARHRMVQTLDPQAPLGPLALSALGHPALGRKLGEDLRAPLGRGALVSRRPPPLDQPRDPAHLLGRFVSRGRRRPLRCGRLF
jgi:hypothetical protein